MRRHGLTVVVLSLVLALALSGYALQGRAPASGPRLFDEVLSVISDRFVDSTGSDELYEKAARGLVEQLRDPYAELVSPKELAAFDAQVAGRYAGLGLLVEDHEGRYFVGRVFPNTPGEHGGVQIGDRIVSVDGRQAGVLKFQEVTGSMKGAPGTSVTVQFERPGVAEPITIRFTRAVIHIPGVPYALLLDGKIGYIPVQQFTEKAGEEAEAAVARLQAQGARGFVLDLRGDGGGYTDQAERIANLFLAPGQEIYRVRTRATAPEVHRATRSPLAPSAPVIVLTDGNSASASEIVAGALQDHDRALVVGAPSFGKGLVQTGFPLDGGWLLKITTGRWLTPSGRSIQKPRRLTQDGRLEEIPVDSADTAALGRARPVYHSDAGRVVYGGGGITPDLLVAPDTIDSQAQALARALAPKSQEAYLALYDLATAVRPGLSPAFTVPPEWRADFYRRLEAHGVHVEQKVFDSAHTYVDRLIEQRVARLAFGDSTARRHSMDDDSPLRRALELLRGGHTQAEMFAALPHS